MKYSHIISAALLSLSAASVQATAPVSPGRDNYYERAVNMYSIGNYAGAADQLRRYLDMDQTSPAGRAEASLLMMQTRVALGEYAQAYSDAQQFLHTYAGSPLVSEVMLVKAQSLFYRGMYGDALHVYEKLPVHTFSPGECSTALYQQAVCMVECGYFEQAQTIFRSLMSDTEYGDMARFYKAYIDYVQADYDNALKGFVSLPADIARQTGADFYIAQIYFANGDWSRVLAFEPSLLTAASRIDSPKLPATSEAWRILGESAYHIGDKERAQAALSKHATTSATGATETARYLLGVMAYDQGLYAKADEWLSPVTKVDDTIGQSALLYLGQSAVRQGDYTSAAMYFDKAAKLPYDSKVAETALYDYAAAVAHGGRVPFGSASSLLEEFGSRYPNSEYTPAVDKYLALGYLAEKRYQKALDKLDRIKSPTPEVRTLIRQVLYEAGVSELGAGNAKQAEYYLRRGANTDAKDQIAQATRLWLAEALYAQGKYSDASGAYTNYIERASNTDSNKALAYYNKGYALYQSGDYKGSRQALSDALAVKGTGALSSELRADALLRMADCDNYMGNVKAALEAYSQAATTTDGAPDYAALQAACMKGLLGDERGKKEALEKMLSTYPQSTWTQQALYELSQAALAMSDYTGAAKAQERLQQLAPDSQMLRESKLQTAAALVSASRTAEGVKAYEQIIRQWPESAQATSAAQYLQTYYSGEGRLDDFMKFLASVPGAPRPSEMEMERLSYLNAMAAVEKSPAAVSQLEEYISKYPSGRYAPDALLTAAQIYVQTRHSDKALKATSDILTKYPASDVALPALLLQADIYKNKGAEYYPQAAKDYATLLQRGGGEYAPEAYMGLMATASDPESVIAYADKFLALSSPDAQQRYEVKMLKADALSQTGHTQEAIALLSTLAKDMNSAEGGAAAVKMAQIYLQGGDTAQAHKLMKQFTDNGCDDLDQLAMGYITLAQVLKAQGDTRLARQYMESLKTNYPGKNAQILSLIDQELLSLKK